MTTLNLTIMFTDIKGFTQRVSDGSRDDLSRLYKLHDRLLTPAFKHFDGTVVKTIGDAFLVRFESPTDAVMCGITIQEILRQHNKKAIEKDQLEVRVAINAGEVELVDNDVLGEPVNIAARLEGIAEAGEVYFTEAVYLTMNRKEAPSAEIGERVFKGIPYPIKIYKAIREDDSDLSVRLEEGVTLTDDDLVITGLHRRQKSETPQEPGSKKGNLFSIIGLAACIVLLTGAFMFFNHSGIEKVIDDIRSDIASEKFLSAFDKSSVALKENPDNLQLQDFAVESAIKYAVYLENKNSIYLSKKWLEKNTINKRYSDRLLPIIMDLDIKIAASEINNSDGQRKKINAAIDKLLSSYPGNNQVPKLLADKIDRKIFPYHKLRLYKKALEEGYDAEGEIFEYCKSLFSYYAPGNILGAHTISTKYYKEKSRSWAIDALHNSFSGREIENGRRILNVLQPDILKTDYAHQVFILLNGYKDEAQAQESLQYFLSLTDEAPKKHILGLHRWIIKPTEEKKISSWGYKRMDLTKANLSELEKSWN